MERLRGQRKTVLCPVALGTALVAFACAPLDDVEPTGANSPATAVTLSSQGGSPAFVQGRLTDIGEVHHVFGSHASELNLIRETADDFGFTHQRWQQTRAGLPVINGDLRVTRDEAGVITAAVGSSWEAALSRDSDIESAIENAIDSAVATDSILGDIDGADIASEPQLVFLAPSNGAPIALVWESFVTGTKDGVRFEDKVFVSAATAEIVDRHPQIHTALNRRTNDAAETPISPEGNVSSALARAEGDPAVGILEIDILHDSLGVGYECFSSLFGRDSYDDLGSELFSIGRIGEYQNASWNSAGRVMAYGVGFVSSDVVIHELSHAVTEYTSALVYRNESGALNESFSDILAAACEASSAGREPQASDWQIGEELAIGPFRYMDNPTQDGNSTDHYDTRYIGEADLGGVHLNSGISNLAFVLAVTGGDHPRLGARPDVVAVAPLGLETSSAIFYRAFTTYLGPNSDFLAARAATQQAASDLYGPGSNEEITISEAWASVGVGGPSIARPDGEPEPETDPENPESDDAPSGANLTGGCSSASGASTGWLSLFVGMAFLGLVRRRRKGQAQR